MNPKKTAEYEYWKDYQDLIPFPLDKNYCGEYFGNRAQSPIDVWDTGAECFEHHEIRDRVSVLIFLIFICCFVFLCSAYCDKFRP